MKTTQVVTAFIRYQGNILLLRRSQKVGSYRGCWAAVSGHIEQVPPLMQALIEIEEETGLVAGQVELRSCGPSIEVNDESLQRCWQIQLFIFELVDEDAQITLDWEHEELRWLAADQLAELDTVPLLAEAYQRCRAAELEFVQSLNALRHDRQQGASALARQALQILQHSAEGAMDCDDEALRQLMALRCHLLRQARPSMGVIDVLLKRWQLAVDERGHQSQPLATTMADQARRLMVLSQQAVAECGRHAARLVQPGQTLLTHSCSSTLMAMFEQLRGQDVKVVVSESRPLNEGVDVARQLHQWGFEVTLITDAQLGLFAARADLVMVGADTVLNDGSVVNKVGTSLLALAAREAGMPFYVVAESYKCTTQSARQMTLERMAADELQHDFPQDHIANIYFDITPAVLITRLIDERGGDS
ncbi:MAG: NUDIX domain-containing protein [Desulfuromonas sp.]|nr:NUDIX domain-containing protein [Desulfuromonas sp.]